MYVDKSWLGHTARISHLVGVILGAVAMQIAAGGCGTSPEEQPDTRQPVTLGSTTVVDGDPPAEPGDGPELTLSFTASTTYCCNPLSIEFVVDTAQMPVGVGILYKWDFGDGRTATGPFVEHTYVAPSVYLVSLVATSSGSVLGSVEQSISLTDDNAGGNVMETAQDDGTDDPVGGDDGGTPPGNDDPLGDDNPDGDGGSDGGDNPNGGDPPDGGGDPAPPTADAGSDQTVEADAAVQLDGTGSSVPPSGPVSYLWSQLAGPAVVLNDAESVTPTFVAPPTDGDPVQLVFSVMVTSAGGSDSDTVAITVEPGEDPREEPPPGVTVWFLSGPDPVSEPGEAEVSWVFVGDVVPTGVILRQGCCVCSDVDSEVLFPDFEGVYRSTIEVPPDDTIWYRVLFTFGGVDYGSQSAYVNPPAGTSPPEPPAVIWFHSRLLDPGILWEVARSGVVTHVMIDGGDRVVQAFDDPIVLEAIEICRSADLKVIWSRFLWNNFEQFQTMEDTWDPEFYASAIAQIQEEAALLGADFSAIDCEAYGNSPLDDYLADDLPPDNFELMGAAIVEAAEQGQVDFVYPTGSHGRPWHANNLYPPLGRVRIAESTFWDLPYKNCRITYSFDVFGAYVQPSTIRAAVGLAPYFLPYDILQRRFHWSAADGAPGTVNGLLLYPGSSPDNEGTVWEVAVMLADFFDTP